MKSKTFFKKISKPKDGEYIYYTGDLDTTGLLEEVNPNHPNHPGSPNHPNHPDR